MLGVSVQPLPFDVVLAAAMSDSSVREVSLSTKRDPDIPQSPFLSGLVLRSSTDGATVVRVLHGTAAEAADLRPGDVITGPNETKLTSLEGSDHRVSVEFAVSRAGHVRNVSLQMTSVSEVFGNLVARARRAQRLQARLDSLP
jgi:S1-C subfamily serine protease